MVGAKRHTAFPSPRPSGSGDGGDTGNQGSPDPDARGQDIVIPPEVQSRFEEMDCSDEEAQDAAQKAGDDEFVVACDPDGPYNPVPVYDRITNWIAPAVRVADHPPLDVMAIDNLPSLLPRESSLDYSQQLLPVLQQIVGQPVSGDGASQTPRQLLRDLARHRP